MHIDWWTLALQTINLLVLVWILSRFLFRPIADIVRQRQAAADELLEKAEAQRQQAEEEEKQAEAAQKAAEKARGNVLQDAGREAESEKAQILADARKQADDLRAAVEAEIERRRKAEQAKIGEQAGALAVEIATKLFTRLPDSAKIDGFVQGLAEAVAKLPGQARDEIGADGAAVTVLAARKMSDAEVASCRDALSGALGREVSVSVKVDPALIAGLEIELPHAAVRNSFHADLDRIATELAGHAEA